MSTSSWYGGGWRDGYGGRGFFVCKLRHAVCKLRHAGGLQLSLPKRAHAQRERERERERNGSVCAQNTSCKRELNESRSWHCPNLIPEGLVRP